MNPEVSFIIPAYNENGTIEGALKQIDGFAKQHFKQYEIVVADDGSTDGTKDTLERLSRDIPALRTVRNSRNEGQGAALRKAFEKACGNIAVTLDCDLSYGLKDTLKLVAGIRAGNDLVIGTPFLNGRFIASRSRKLLSIASNRIYRIAIGAGISAYTSNFRAYSRPLYEQIRKEFKSNGSAAKTEIIWRAFRSGARIAEVPSDLIVPEGRKSHMKPLRDSTHHLALLSRILGSKLLGFFR